MSKLSNTFSRQRCSKQLLTRNNTKFWVTLKQSSYFSFCPPSADCPSVQPEKTSPVRPRTSDLGPIQPMYHLLTLLWMTGITTSTPTPTLPNPTPSSTPPPSSIRRLDGRTDRRKFLLRFRTAPNFLHNKPKDPCFQLM